MLVIKEKHTVSATLTSGQDKATYNIGGTVALNKAILLFTYRGNTGDYKQYALEAYLSSPTEITVVREISGTELNIQFQVVEYTAASNITVQQISGAMTGLTFSATTSSYTQSNTFIIPSYSCNLGSWASSGDVAFNTIVAGNAIELERNGSINTINFRIQVVEMNDISVQQVAFNTNVTPTDVTVSSVDLTKTFAFASTRHTIGCFRHINRASMLNSTTARLEQVQGAQTLDGYVYVVEFQDETIIASLNDGLTGTESDINKTITSVDVSNTWIFPGSSVFFGFPSNNATDQFKDTGHELELTSATNINLKRTSPTQDSIYNVWIVTNTTAANSSKWGEWRLPWGIGWDEWIR